LKEKSYKKVQGKPDRSARFAGPAPPHCLRGIVVLECRVGLTILGVGIGWILSGEVGCRWQREASA